MATYYYEATTSEDIDCESLFSSEPTVDDTCHIRCNIANPVPPIGEVSCATAGKCIIESVDKEGCFKGTMISAENTKDLYINFTQKESNAGGVINLPINGNATIIATAMGNDVLKDVLIQSHSTDNIYVSCIDPTSSYNNECSSLFIDASDAKYLEVNIVNADYNKDPSVSRETEIFCPLDNGYNGPQPAACILNMTQADIISDITIHAANGSPKDVILYTSDTVNISNIVLSCNNGISVINNVTGLFDRESPCWLTESPTINPTTSFPTNPTNNPSIYPTFPTNIPSLNPSSYPTMFPSEYPSSNPTEYQILSTISTSIYDVIDTSSPSVSSTVFNDDSMLNDNESLDPVIIIVAVVAVVMLCLGVMIGWFVSKKCNKHNASEETTTSTSVTDVQYEMAVVNADDNVDNKKIDNVKDTEGNENIEEKTTTEGNDTGITKGNTVAVMNVVVNSDNDDSEDMYAAQPGGTNNRKHSNDSEDLFNYKANPTDGAAQ